ncbi:hypothetical protein JCM10213v2_002105 [Rhodosporidiobolus nylandii]
MATAAVDPLYLRYYSGHVGSYGHEFIEFEISQGRLRFALNSNFKCVSWAGDHAATAGLIQLPDAGLPQRVSYPARNDCGGLPCLRFQRISADGKVRSRHKLVLIKRISLAVFLSPATLAEFKRIVEESEVVKEDDANWPKKNVVGKQELEVKLGNYHISFETAKIGSLVDVQNSDDPEGLRVFYYLVQDLKIFVYSLISLHFKIKPTH